MTEGFDVFVQLVMAAMTTEPLCSLRASRSVSSRCVGPFRSSMLGPCGG